MYVKIVSTYVFPEASEWVWIRTDKTNTIIQQVKLYYVFVQVQRSHQHPITITNNHAKQL